MSKESDAVGHKAGGFAAKMIAANAAGLITGFPPSARMTGWGRQW
ncbi:hypothetical protein [Candidatus Spongiihabitans sp.]